MEEIIIYTSVYGRNVLMHLAGGEVSHVRVIGDEGLGIGTIALGRVTKMIPSSNACFLVLGDGKEYFLTIPEDLSELTFADGKDHADLHCEDIILVQVSSEAVKLKAPSVTCRLSLTGSLAVTEMGRGFSFSKKIDTAQRKTVILPDKIDNYTGQYHVIIRTKAASADDPDELAREIEEQTALLDDIRKKCHVAKGLKVLYSPSDQLGSAVTEWCRNPVSRIITDDPEAAERLKDISGRLPGDPKFVFYDDPDLALCKLYKLETLLDTCLSKRYYMKSGGFLVIEQGETLTAIDVNSGHAVKGDKEETSFKLNLEAADHIARILKNRNLSGMILIDFINMKDISHRKELISRMKDNLSHDDVHSAYVDITGLGLMEITRQRKYRSLAEQWNIK